MSRDCIGIKVRQNLHEMIHFVSSTLIFRKAKLRGSLGYKCAEGAQICYRCLRMILCHPLDEYVFWNIKSIRYRFFPNP